MVRLGKTKEELVKMTFFILLGNALLAFAVTAFVRPHGIMMGGTTGIALIVTRISGIDTALLVFLMNVALLVLGLAAIGKKLFATSIASTILYPMFLSLFQRYPDLGRLTDDRLLAALYAGALIGLSIGLVMRVGASTGGMDIANLVLAKWTHKRVAVFVYLTDMLVIAAQALVSQTQSILYGIILLLLESFAVDRVMIFGRAKIQLFVISRSYEQIRRRFLTELSAGVTMMSVETGVRGERALGVMCVIPSRKMYAADAIVRSADPEAFVTVTKIKEVRGGGFTTARKSVDLTAFVRDGDAAPPPDRS